VVAMCATTGSAAAVDEDSDERAACAALEDVVDDHNKFYAGVNKIAADFVHVGRRANRSHNVRLARTIAVARTQIAAYIQETAGSRYESMSPDERRAAWAPTGNLIFKAAQLCNKAGYRIHDL